MVPYPTFLFEYSLSSARDRNFYGRLRCEIFSKGKVVLLVCFPFAGMVGSICGECSHLNRFLYSSLSLYLSTALSIAPHLSISSSLHLLLFLKLKANRRSYWKLQTWPWRQQKIHCRRGLVMICSRLIYKYLYRCVLF
jgi:hypothetical protein